MGVGEKAMKLKSPSAALSYWLSGCCCGAGAIAAASELNTGLMTLFVSAVMLFNARQQVRDEKRDAEHEATMARLRREVEDAKLFPCTLTFEPRGRADVPNVPPMGTEDSSTLPRP
jgi:hypothetical protein